MALATVYGQAQITPLWLFLLKHLLLEGQQISNIVGRQNLVVTVADKPDGRKVWMRLAYPGVPQIAVAGIND